MLLMSADRLEKLIFAMKSQGEDASIYENELKELRTRKSKSEKKCYSLTHPHSCTKKRGNIKICSYGKIDDKDFSGLNR